MLLSNSPYPGNSSYDHVLKTAQMNIGKDQYGQRSEFLSLVETARSFIDYPYAWGGASAEEGFDCSGLMMAVYRLNGLDLPRSLYAQFESGRPVGIMDLRPGDLVFFATGGDDRVSHVGIYISEGVFIHAPGTNKTVRSDALSNPYFRTRFCGARCYLGDF